MKHPEDSKWQADIWLRRIPEVHRALGGGFSRFDCQEKDVARSLEAACSFWEALHYTMKALLAWDSPAVGLAAWYAAGKPMLGSDVLRLIQAWCGGEQLLNLYAAWCWAGQKGFVTVDDIQPHIVARTASFGDENWWLELKRQADPIAYSPLLGGTNPLHLGHSDVFGLDEGNPNESYLIKDQSTRRAVLVVSGFGRWRTELKEHGDGLPSMQERSWHVEVLDRQFGSLGTFRRSRQTGKWFAGTHSAHVLGCLAAAD